MQVDLDHPVEVGDRSGEHGLLAVDHASTVRHRVQATEPIDPRSDGTHHVIRITRIRDDGTRPSTLSVDQIHDLGQGAIPTPGNHHSRALAGERHGRRPTDSGATTDDEGDLAGQTRLHVFPSPLMC